MIPAHWKTATLGDLCQIIKGNFPIMKTKPGPYPLVTMGEDHKTANSYQLDTEAVCVPMISSFGHGKAGLKRVHYISGKFALANILSALVVKDPTLVSTKYLALYLQTFKDQLIVPLQTGAANMSLSIEKLAGIPVHYPLIEDQRKIINIIDEIDSIQSLQNRSKSRIDDYIPSLFYELFGNPQLKPQKWIKKELKQLAVLIRGVTFAKENVTDIQFPGGVPILRAGNISNTIDVNTETDLVWVNSKSVSGEQFLQPFDIVIAMSSGSIKVVGKTALLWDDWKGSFGAFCGVIRAFDISPLYLFGLTKTDWYIEWAKSTAQGANINNLRKTHLEDLLIPIPPKDLQTKFESGIKEIRSVQVMQYMNKQNLNQLHDATLATMFRGTL